MLQIMKDFRHICYSERFILYLCIPKKNKDIMSRICEITGKKAMVGNSVSHSNRKTKRRFNPNLQEKRFFVPEEKKWVTIKVSTAGIKIINKRGIYACLKEAREKGYITSKTA